jgi:thiol-disulfide isomerase/thioredoxin
MYTIFTKVFSSNLLILFVITSCGSIEKNKVNSINDNGHLLGEITITELQKSEHNSWFTIELKTYKLDTVTLLKVDSVMREVEKLSIKVFMATWCEDSHRELPRFYKIMNHLNFNNYQVFAMDYHKETPENYEEGLSISHVPTFVVYSGDKELNRIVESPIKSIEKDLILILKAKNYIPNYHE